MPVPSDPPNQSLRRPLFKEVLLETLETQRLRIECPGWWTGRGHHPIGPFQDRLRNGLRIADGHDLTIHSWLDEIARTGVRGEDDRQTARHGFKGGAH